MPRVRTILRMFGVALGVGVGLAVVLVVVTENDPSRPRWLSPLWLLMLVALGCLALFATRGSSRPLR